MAKTYLKRISFSVASPDRILVILTLVLTVVGFLMMTNASVVQAQNLFGDKFFFAKQQLMWVGVGITGFLISSRVPYTFWRALASPIFFITLGLLVVVLIPQIGSHALGARRWIELAGVTFQPAELAKLAIILYSARWLSGSQIKEGRKYLLFFGLLFLVCALILLEPDLGTAVVVAITALSMLFFAGIPLYFFAGLLPIAALSGLILIMISSYRKERFLSFLQSLIDPLQASYHVKQILIAIASGGLLGVGLGQSRQKFLFLPEATTDSIFAVMAEEVGFIGALALILVFAGLISRIFLIAKSVDEKYAKMVAGGVGVWLGSQIFINIAAMTATLPLTGIPLPFFSYGGSALVMNLFSLGMVANISKR
ncbi:putative lipid II flippase FtsW [Candidatus Microgenomates bacterium]|nr:putative lipid II flippase FtsW [Candidatus Microgenomates bacterium]